MTAILLFDGHCNLCNGAVQWIIRRDSRFVIGFSPLTGDFATKLLAERSELSQIDSLILVEGTRVLVKSDAAIRIAQLINYMPWMMRIVRHLPQGVRDLAYDLIARYRYRLFGRKHECMMPTPELKSRFVA